MELKEMRQKSKEKLEAALQEARAGLEKLRFSRASGQLKRVREIRLTRKEIARILTIFNQRKNVKDK